MKAYYKITYLLTNNNNTYVLELNYYRKTNTSIINLITKNKSYEVSIDGQVLGFDSTNVKYKDNIFDICLNTSKSMSINRHFLLYQGKIKVSDFYKIDKGYIKYDDFILNIANYDCISYIYQGKYIDNYLVSYSYNFSNYGSFMFLISNMRDRLKLVYISAGKVKSVKLRCKVKEKNDIISLKANNVFSMIKYDLSLEGKIKTLSLKDDLSTNYMYSTSSEKTKIVFENDNFKFKSQTLNSINISSYNL